MKKLLAIVLALACLVSGLCVGTAAEEGNYSGIFEGELSRLYWSGQIGFDQYSGGDFGADAVFDYCMKVIDFEAKYGYGDKYGSYYEFYAFPAEVFEGEMRKHFAIDDEKIAQVRQITTWLGGEDPEPTYDPETNTYRICAFGGMGDSVGSYLNGYAKNEDNTYSVYAFVVDYACDYGMLEEGMVEGKDYIITHTGNPVFLISMHLFTIECDGKDVKFLDADRLAYMPEVEGMVIPEIMASDGENKVHAGSEMLPADTELSVSAVSAGDAYDNVQSAFAEVTEDIFVYEVSCTTVQADSKIDGNFTLEVSYPLNADGTPLDMETLAAFHVAANGDITPVYAYGWYDEEAGEGYAEASFDKPGTVVFIDGVKRGFLDEDDTISATDALLTLQTAVGKIELSAKEQLNASVDKTPGVGASDALAILQYAVGKIYQMPCEVF